MLQLLVRRQDASAVLAQQPPVLVYELRAGLLVLVDRPASEAPAPPLGLPAALPVSQLQDRDPARLLVRLLGGGRLLLAALALAGGGGGLAPGRPAADGGDFHDDVGRGRAALPSRRGGGSVAVAVARSHLWQTRLGQSGGLRKVIPLVYFVLLLAATVYDLFSEVRCFSLLVPPPFAPSLRPFVGS